jgi:hypothetical protein
LETFGRTFISGARKGKIYDEVCNAMAVKSSEQKEQLGLIFLTASCSNIGNLVVNEIVRLL